MKKVQKYFFFHHIIAINIFWISQDKKKQAWKLSAIKSEPNLSMLWEVRQIHLKKRHFWPKSHFKFDKRIFGQKAVSAENWVCFFPKWLCYRIHTLVNDQQALELSVQLFLTTMLAEAVLQSWLMDLWL